ncbi:MAG: hypothetical protein LBR17_08225 [Bacteroidales bacterium]|jgi:hypothetical protein|nr:hypothetical protein [Bacteroidales bacterium]
MNRTIEDVWQWFLSNHEALMDIDSLDDAAAEELLLKFDDILKSYSEGIDFEIGDLTPHGRTLLLTTNGNDEYFEDVFALFEAFPSLDFWEIVPLKQPSAMENPLIRYEKYCYKASDVWFLPMESTDETEERLGLRIGISDYEPENETQLIAIYLLLEAILGEYQCGTLIGYWEACPLPNDPSSEGFIPLKDLKLFV